MAARAVGQGQAKNLARLGRLVHEVRRHHAHVGRARVELVAADERGNAEIFVRALEVYIHEMLHHYAPEWSETKVSKTALAMSQILSKARFRRIER